jgi:hypothetical protein
MKSKIADRGAFETRGEWQRRDYAGRVLEMGEMPTAGAGIAYWESSHFGH